MVIYSNNFAEKLFGYAISREYLKYSSPFCDLLDDPNLKIDFDLAINFNKGLNGDIEAANIFTEDFIINGSSLDVSTINFYVKKMYQYPIWHSQIERVYYVFGYVNRIGESKVDFRPSESRFINKLLDALKDCLTSPCNYFAANSNSVGKLAETTANTNTGTIPPFKELFGEISTVIGGMGKDLFNKIPEAFQRSSIELAAIGQAAFAESVAMFTKDNKDELIKKAKGKISLRGGTTAGDSIFTTDYKSYLDHTSASTKILEKVAGSMGDCFKQYEQSYRYNPYNPDMNLNISNKSQVNDQNNGALFERDITGQVITEGGYDTLNNATLGTPVCSDNVASGATGGSGVSYSTDAEGVTTEPNTNTGDVLYEFTVGEQEPGTSFVNRVTLFGGWYDTEDTEAVDSKTVWADSYGFTSGEGNANDKNTQAGIGNVPGVIYCPSTPGQISQTSSGAKNGFVKLINDGWVSSGKVDAFEAKKFNHGVAIITHDYRKYLKGKGLKTSDCVAELSYNGKVLKNVNIIDTGGALARQAVRLDMTPYIFNQLTGKRPNGPSVTAKSSRGRDGIGSDGQPVVEYYTLEDKTKVRHRFIGWPSGMGAVPLAGMKVRILRKGSSGATTATTIGRGTGNVTQSQGKLDKDGKPKIRKYDIQEALLRILQNAAAEVKVDLNVTSGGQLPNYRPEGASTRHDYGWAADFEIRTGGRPVDCSLGSKDIPLLQNFVRALRRNGATGIGMAPDYMGLYTMHADIAIKGKTTSTPPLCWGAGGYSVNAPGWLKEAFYNY